ncbi:S1/P1 nuclease [Robertkochia flava]|uniref:S1/P1 nuclease n=1 Tax=Robertkochia flava TaxID=3447986 RepID=UPI001CCF42EC|nr:S1/P1 nuclease [Robertkochia marina]
MRFICFLICFFPLWVTAGNFPDDWGKTGHRTTAEVASYYLTPVARERINSLLQGKSLALVSNFADDIKSDERYRALDPWHYVNFPLDKGYKDQSPSASGDIAQAIGKCIRVLKDPASDREEKEFHLKLLIHFIGDLHQPLHIGRAEDKGGNDIQVRWFSRGTNLHRVWDTEMIESFDMSFTELSQNLPVVTPEEVIEIAKGDYMDWMQDTRKITSEVYNSARVGEKLGYRYMYDHFDTVRWQLLKGGIRLAALLNEIFNEP